MTKTLDLTSISSVIDAMYAMVSGPAGSRDWSLQKTIFQAEARQTRTGVDADGKPWLKMMSLDDYAADAAPFFAANDFYEMEVAHRVERFGNIAHVWSTYEYRRSPDAAPHGRGINSIQLFHDGDRWWVLSVLWDNEREGNPLPEEYLVRERDA